MTMVLLRSTQEEKRNTAVHNVTRAWSKIPLDEEGLITADIAPEQIGRLAPWCQTRWKNRRALLVAAAENIRRHVSDPGHRRILIANKERELSQDKTHLNTA